MHVLLYILPVLLVMMAQTMVSSSYSKYRNIRTMKGYTGEMVARMILDRHHLSDVDVGLSKGGIMSDYYDPRLKSVRLSSDVYYGNSLAAIAIAAHEVGHAIQDTENWYVLRFRNHMIPYVNAICQFGWVILFLGLLFTSTSCLYLGSILLLTMVIFQLVTLPIEINASKRALSLLYEGGIVIEDEREGVENMLRAAAFTYIAALASSIIYLLRIFMFASNKRN